MEMNEGNNRLVDSQDTVAQPDVSGEKLVTATVGESTENGFFLTSQSSSEETVSKAVLAVENDDCIDTTSVSNVIHSVPPSVDTSSMDFVIEGSLGGKEDYGLSAAMSVIDISNSNNISSSIDKFLLLKSDQKPDRSVTVHVQITKSPCSSNDYVIEGMDEDMEENECKSQSEEENKGIYSGQKNISARDTESEKEDNLCDKATSSPDSEESSSEFENDAFKSLHEVKVSSSLFNNSLSQDKVTSFTGGQDAAKLSAFEFNNKTESRMQAPFSCGNNAGPDESETVKDSAQNSSYTDSKDRNETNPTFLFLPELNGTKENKSALKQNGTAFGLFGAIPKISNTQSDSHLSPGFSKILAESPFSATLADANVQSSCIATPEVMIQSHETMSVDKLNPLSFLPSRFFTNTPDKTSSFSGTCAPASQYPLNLCSSVSKSYSLFPNASSSLQNCGDQTKVSFSFPLKSGLNTGLGISNVFSNMPASKNSFVVDTSMENSATSLSNSDNQNPEAFLNFGTSSAKPLESTHFKFFPRVQADVLKYNFIDPRHALCSPSECVLGYKKTTCTESNIDTASAAKDTAQSIGAKSIFSCPNINTDTYPSGKFCTSMEFLNTERNYSPTLEKTIPKMPVGLSTVNISQSPFLMFGSKLPTSESTVSSATPSVTSSTSLNWFGLANSSGKNSGITGLFDIKSETETDLKGNITHPLPVSSLFGRNNISSSCIWSNPSEKTSSKETLNYTPTFLNSPFTFGFSTGFNPNPVQNTSWNSCSNTPFSNRFNFGSSSSLTPPSTVSFNFTGSDKKAKLKAQGKQSYSILNRLRNHRPPNNPQVPIRASEAVPFRVVTELDTYVKNGVIHTIKFKHQHITAMPEYSDLSFEELRHRYFKYDIKKHAESKVITVSKKVQTTEDLWEPGNYLIDLWKILECPVCLEIVSSPVMQCERGHHVCNNCWKRVASCPLCKRFRTTTRNYVAEAMVERLPLPCKYRVDGCKKTLHKKEKAVHEGKCFYRTYPCLVENCNQAHSCQDMRVHLKNSHNHLMSGILFNVPSGEKFSYTVNKPLFQSLIQTFDIAGWGLFFLCSKETGENIFLFMQVINTDNVEKQFLYNVEVTDAKELQSVSYKGPVLQLHSPVVEKQLDCLIVSNTLLRTLKKDCGFHVKVLIWRNDDIHE